MIRVDTPANLPTMGTPARSGEPGSGMSGAQTGQLRGEQVRLIPDGMVTLANNAEEISLFHAEKAEQKDFEERQVEGEQIAELMRLEQILAHLEMSKAFDDPRKLAEIAKQMLQGEDSPRGLAKQNSKSPSQQSLLLQYALHQGEKDGAPPQVMEALRDALADLEMEFGPQIRAGLNNLEAAAQWASDSADPATDIAAFQSAYEDVVLGQPSMAQTVQSLLERLGGPQGEGFAKGLAATIAALGHDLAAARPSTEPARLQSLLQDLYQLEVVATVLDGCRGLCDQINTQHGAANAQATELMKSLVAVTNEKWVSGSRFTGMAEAQGATSVGASIAFQTGVKGLLRELPPIVFPDTDTRQSILAAQQEALDAAIEREDA